MTAGPLVAFLVAQPTATAALLATHVDDGRGRCRGCAGGGGAGPTWPCTLRVAAATAHRIRTQRDAAR
jgi:hypothetical protein